MAAWQVSFHVIPRLPVSDFSPMALEKTEWWAAADFPSDYHRRLAEVAPATPSEGSNLETWGPEDGNRVDVWSEGGRVRRVKVQVDVRRLDSKFGAALLTFVRAADAVLIRGDGLIVAPTIGAYAGALRTSLAWRFASDPTPFVISLSESEKDDQ
jgi:hypothetical protein